MVSLGLIKAVGQMRLGLEFVRGSVFIMNDRSSEACDCRYRDTSGGQRS